MVNKVYNFPRRKLVGFGNGGGIPGAIAKLGSRFGGQVTVPSGGDRFFGANIHIKYGDGTGEAVDNYPQNQTVQSYVDKAMDLGLGWYRTNCNTAKNVTDAIPYFKALRDKGVETLIVIDAGITLTNSYATNYAAGKSLGQAIATASKGYVRHFETSNEIDINCRVDAKDSAGNYLWNTNHNLRTDGTTPDGGRRIDFYQPALDAWFGWNTGIVDGIRSVMPDAQLGYATGAGFGAYIVGEMWKKGLDVNGNVVRAPVDINFQGLHWYESMGDPRAATPHGEATLNVMQEIWRRMGVPTIVSEWGSSIKDATTNAAQASQLTTRATSYWNNRVADHVVAIIFYAMFPNPTREGDTPTTNWGLVQSDGVTIKPSYTAYKNFIASTPKDTNVQASVSMMGATFWGMNGHPRQVQGPNQQTQQPSHWEQAITSMVDLGMKVYRCDYGVNYDLSKTPIVKTTTSGTLFQQFITQAAGRVQIAPVLDPYRDDLAAGDETAAYNRGYENGVDCATYLKDKGIPWIEVGNELEWRFSDTITVRTDHTLGGQNVSQYNNAGFISARGLIRGMIAGIKSVDTTNSIKIMMSGITSYDIAFYQMLRNGTTPSNATPDASKIVDWDISSWHWYINKGGIGDDPELGAFNMLGALNALGKPIVITECGANWVAYGRDEAAVGDAIIGSTLFGKFTQAIRTKFNVLGVFYYQLMDCAGDTEPADGDEMNYGVINFSFANKSRYAKMKTFVAANP